MSLYNKLQDAHVNLSETMHMAYQMNCDELSDVEFLDQITDKGIRKVVERMLHQADTPQGFIWRIKALAGNEDLISRFIYTTVLFSTLTVHKHMILPTQLYEFNKIPMSMLHAIGEFETKVDYKFFEDVIPYQNIYLGPFKSLPEFDKWNIIESFLWGLQIPTWNPELRTSLYVLVNNAALMGFLNSEILFSDNEDIWEIYAKWYSRYSEALADDTVREQLRGELAKDEFSQFYGEGMNTDFFGFTNSALSKTPNVMSYFDIYNFPYGAVKWVEQVFKDDMNIWQFEPYRRQSFVFTDRDRARRLQKLCKDIDYFVDINILMDPELTTELADYLMDKLRSAVRQLRQYKLKDSEYEYCFDKILYSIYSMAHKRYNNLSDNILDVIYGYSFNKKYIDAYGELAYGRVIEAQNEFSNELNEYMSSVLTNVMATPIDFDPLLEKYQGSAEVLFLLASFDRDGLDFGSLDHTLEMLIQNTSNVQEYVKKMASVQKLLDEVKDPNELQTYTVTTFVSELVDVSDELLVDTLSEIYKIISVGGYKGFVDALAALAILRSSENKYSAEVVNAIMGFVRCCEVRGVLPKQDYVTKLAKLAPSQIEFLSNLVWDGVDVSTYIELPQEKLEQYAELSETMPNIVRYLNALESSSVFELASRLHEMTGGEVLPLQDLNTLGDYSVFVTQLLEENKITPQQVTLFGYDRFFWKLMFDVNERLLNFKDLVSGLTAFLRTCTVNFNDIVALTDIEKISDLYNTETRMYPAVDAEYCKEWYKGILHKFSMQYMKSIPFAKNVQRGFEGVDFVAVSDACSEVVLAYVPPALQLDVDDRFVDCVYKAVRALVLMFSFDAENWDALGSFDIMRIDTVFLMYCQSTVANFCCAKLPESELSPDVFEASQKVARLYNKNALSIVGQLASRIHRDAGSQEIFSPALDLFSAEVVSYE